VCFRVENEKQYDLDGRDKNLKGAKNVCSLVDAEVEGKRCFEEEIGGREKVEG
jgi:hypothetical protein